jgi:transcriptional regulator with XRE-family HTH domain
MIEAIRYRMETGGYTQADLGRLLGSRQRASDILKRKRPLTMRMAWRLHREWGIPAEAVIAPPRTRGRRSAALSVQFGTKGAESSARTRVVRETAAKRRIQDRFERGNRLTAWEPGIAAGRRLAPWSTQRWLPGDG